MSDLFVADGDFSVDLDRLQARCLGNLDLVERVLQTFAMQLDADLVQLEESLRTGDFTRFARIAHRIKGMSANSEARALATEAAAAEQAARDCMVDQLPTHLDRLRSVSKGLTESLVKAAS